MLDDILICGLTRYDAFCIYIYEVHNCPQSASARVFAALVSNENAVNVEIDEDLID